MSGESTTTASARKKYATQFAAWLMLSPEFEDWEERSPVVSDMNRIEDRMQRDGRPLDRFLPSLRKSDQETIQAVAAWTENAMAMLEITTPTPHPDENATEKVTNLVYLLSAAAIPREPSWNR